MKNLFRNLSACVAIFAIALSLNSCSVFANMSEEDAYNVGYGAGTFLRNLIDN